MNSSYRLLVNLYRKARESLEQASEERFPVGSWVRRNPHRIIGRVVAVVEGSPDLISVELENGNVWAYPALDLEPIAADAPGVQRVADAIERLRMHEGV